MYTLFCDWVKPFKSKYTLFFYKNEVYEKDGFKGGTCGPGPPHFGGPKKIRFGQDLYKAIHMTHRTQRTLQRSKKRALTRSTIAKLTCRV